MTGKCIIDQHRGLRCWNGGEYEDRRVLVLLPTGMVQVVHETTWEGGCCPHCGRYADAFGPRDSTCEGCTPQVITQEEAAALVEGLPKALHHHGGVQVFDATGHEYAPGPNGGCMICHPVLAGELPPE